MFIRKLVTGIVLSAATFVPALSHAGTPTHQEAETHQAARSQTTQAPCLLSQYRISSVTPYRVQQNMGGRIIVNSVTGAQFYVQAEPGLTAEWLWLDLQRHVAAMQGPTSMNDCVLDIDKLQVQVGSAGPGFWVRLIAPDAKAGQEVLRRAQLLAS